MEMENVCCPYFTVIDCADTEEHKHILCAASGTVISNETGKNYCIGNFRGCVSFRMDDILEQSE